MKKYFILLLLIIFYINTYSQVYNYPPPDVGNGILRGGMGLNWIDGELHYAFHLTPEFSFNNFGVGLDLQLNFNKQGKLRTEDFNEVSDYLRIIRYVRYGEKGDPAFIKFGALDYYTLGHGSIMYNYNNSPTYDNRKAGLIADISFSKFGIETIYSDFSESGIFGVRGYYHPFQFTDIESIPIIGKLEIGASFVTDFNQNAGKIFPIITSPNQTFTAVSLNVDAIKIIGIDIGFPIITSRYFNLLAFADFNKILDFGHGFSTGFSFQLKNLGLVKITGKFERRLNGDHYIPSYFNSLYEIERINVNKTNKIFSSKASILFNRTASDNGIFGEMGITVAGLLKVKGSYQRLDKTPKSGFLHFSTEINPENSSFLIRAGYDKINIGSETAIFRLDNNSYFYFEYGYKLNQYLLLSALYKWNYTPIKNSNDDVIGFKPQKRFEPRISFIYPIRN